MAGTHAPVADRLSRRLTPTEPPITTDRLGRPITGPCLLWVGGKNQGGYGIIKTPDGVRVVHRVAYGIANGLTNDQFGELDHLCRVRHCAQVTHVEVVSHGENCARADIGLHNKVKDRCPQGHPYDEVNTRMSKGRRNCRECGRDAARKYEAAHPERRQRPWARDRKGS